MDMEKGICPVCGKECCAEAIEILGSCLVCENAALKRMYADIDSNAAQHVYDYYAHEISLGNTAAWWPQDLL